MNIVVSACLLGRNCKYNGKNNRNERVLSAIEGHNILPVCPEVTGGLPTPRKPSELRNGCAVNNAGEDVDRFFKGGVKKTMEVLKGISIDCAVLQSRSPSCGVKQIYDGTFTKTLIDGRGLFAQALADTGVRLIDAEDVPEKL